MMTLFTEPADRAKAMGIFGFVASGGGSIGVLLGGVLTDSLSWHWIFLVNVPVGVARRRPLAAAPACVSRPGCRTAPRRRGRGHRHRRPHAGRLRDRQRQRGGLDVRPDARPARRGGGAAGDLRRDRGARAAHRSCRSASSGSATSWSRTSSVSSGPRRCSPGSSSLRSTSSSCSATARSQVGLAFLPAKLIMGALSVGLSAKLVMRFGIRPPLAAGLALAAAGLAAVRAGAGGRELRGRRPAEHDPARPRCRHRVQPGAARRDERRRAERGGTRLGRRQHLVHDGRRARARSARQPRRLPHGHPAGRRRRARWSLLRAATTSPSSSALSLQPRAPYWAPCFSAPAPRRPRRTPKNRSPPRLPPKRPPRKQERSESNVQGTHRRSPASP